MSTPIFSSLAATAVRTVDRVPTLVWAAWIVGVVVGAALLAVNNAPAI